MVKFATAKPARLQVNALLILNKQRNDGEIIDLLG